MPMPKKPAKLHWLSGTKSQAATEADFVVPASRPRLPKDLSPEALVIFKRLCALLKSRRALTAGDSELLRLYAVTHVRHAKAIAKIQEQGEVCVYTRMDSNGAAHEVEKENLWLKIAFNAEKNLVAILDRLGLTPHNRDKVKPAAPPVPKEPEQTPEERELEAGRAFLNRQKP
jgi:P27 family predicted phage terminase small subunit